MEESCKPDPQAVHSRLVTEGMVKEVFAAVLQRPEARSAFAKSGIDPRQLEHLAVANAGSWLEDIGKGVVSGVITAKVVAPGPTDAV